MDTSPQANQGENVPFTKSDWFNFEQKFMAAIQELKLKRTLVAEMRQEIQQTMMQNHEKDALLDQERRKARELQINLSTMTQMVQKWEEERKALADAATPNKALLDIAVVENDLLKDKVHNLQLEVMRLRTRAEEREAQLHCLQDLQSNTAHEQAQLQAVVDKLKGHLKMLKEDHGKISKRFERTNELAAKLKLVAGQLSSLDAHHSHQVRGLEEKLIASNVELDALKAGKIQTLSSNEGVVNQKYVKEWEESMKAMRSRLSAQTETISQLNATLGAGIAAQRDLLVMDTQARAELTQVKAALEAERATCDDLRARLEKSAESLRVSQEMLKHEQEVHKRPECLDFSTQTQSQFYADKEVMTDAPEPTAIIHQEHNADSAGGAELDVVKTEQEGHVGCEELCCQPTQENQPQ